jgi:diguanylate cyclase (GGDEF)-like protein
MQVFFSPLDNIFEEEYAYCDPVDVGIKCLVLYTMANDLKKINTILLASSIAVSLSMALTTIVFLVLDLKLPPALNVLIVVILVLSPFPALSAMFLLRSLTKYVKKAEKLTTRDPLTGLFNQHAFWDMLEYETQRSMRQMYKFSLLNINIDNFKIISNTYGHEVGDRFLKDFSDILRDAVRKGDIPARYAGDNFAAILPVCDEEQAYIVAKRLMDALRSFSITLPDGVVIQETVSIGAAVYPSHAKDAKDLFLLADSMLHSAKSSGKDNMAFPSDGDNIEMLKYLTEKNIMILDAIQHRKKRIVPFFQPIIHVKDRSVMAYEVLTRIIVGDRVIPAADFIEAAESMGAIGKIDYQLIEQAFIKVKEKQYTGTLFLNLSPKAMVIKDFMPTIRALFRDYTIDPGDMVFEITERDTVKNMRLFETFVRTLKDEGFRFAIDDFGAGYSSFQYLKNFPVDYLKVDGEFIRTMCSNGGMVREIVSSIASLANRLNIKTIAEFVESESIFNEVDSAGIDYAQGYHIQRPSPNLT